MITQNSRSRWVLFYGLFILCLSASHSLAQSEKVQSDNLKMEVRRWTWNSLNGLKEARELPRLMWWQTGKVIVVGGGSELRAVALKTTEVFDERTHEWSAGPQLNYPRRDAEVVRLSDGRLLAIGGSHGATRTGSSTAEVLEPEARRWKLVANMSVARIGHTAIVLDDGRVLVIGGQVRPSQYTATAEIYDHRKNLWASAGRMNEARSLHHARLLKDGKVLVIGGGTDISATSTCEIFDPKSNSWRYVGSLKEPRWGFASAVLEDGRVLVAGGRVPSKKGPTLAEDQMVILQGAELYDPKTRQWAPTTPMSIPRTMGLPNVELRKLPNGGLLFVGGRTYPAPYHGTTSVEYFDPIDNTWTTLSPMKLGRSYQATIDLSNGEILVVGGRGPKFLPLREVECFEPRK